ncbi:MAG: alkyl hydroperoxide reductase, partial [Calditrichaeota bacterium]
MAQLRQAYPELQARDVEVLVVGPDSREDFERFWTKEQLPFPGLPDPEQTVLKLYGQEFNWLRLGRMPAQILIDRSGLVCYA